ncbi:ATP synthase protein I [Arthrobacter pigmenti]|uniref:ATP synthase protein I n=1 Tax=Arthrobacter pigmenti TaxID=271432 RepID=A0A846RMH9_9MICC|nr:hypothetical protein [Arthrobacter pigmenti]NJC22820.1 ATP synthase protein I [Arthrobacter pigmenti]
MNTPDASRAGVSAVSASEATQSLWLRILVRCLISTAVPLVAVAGTAFFIVGPSAGMSSVFGWLLVALFFGVSLLIGHFAGRSNPSGALGLFAVTYAIKVVGFAAVLFFVGAPSWLERSWFFGAAVGTVVVWQIVEIAVFAGARHQLYDHQSASQTEVDRA